MYAKPNVSYLQVEHGCVHIDICVYNAEAKPNSATEITPVHLNGPCHQACILHTHTNRAYRKVIGVMIKEKHFMF